MTPAAPGRSLIRACLMRGGEPVPGTVVVEDGIVVELCYGRLLTEPWARTYELPDGIVLPGLIDMHLHGGGGYATTDGREALRALGRWLAAHGVTGFLASVPPGPWEELLARCRTVAEAASAGDPPNLLGLHLEGPFLSPARAGALAEDAFRHPTAGAYRALRAAAGSALKVLTMAPELPGAGEVAAACRRDGVVAAMGHTDATYEEAQAGFDAGISHVTHLFNAMSPFHHRAPGAAGAALASETAVMELICDGQHLHPGALALAQTAAGAGSPRLVLVSDALPAAGTSQSAFVWEGRPVTRRQSRLVLADGTLAGSAVPLIGAVDWAARSGFGTSAAIAMATANPAFALGLASRKGRLVPGLEADVVVVDRCWRVLLTLVRGFQMWPAPAAGP